MAKPIKELKLKPTLKHKNVSDILKKNKDLINENLKLKKNSSRQNQFKTFSSINPS